MRQHTDGRRRLAPAAGLGAVWLAFYAAWLAVRPGGERALTIFADTAYLVPLAAAFALSVYAWRRVPPELRSFWGLTALACFAWLAADTLWCVRDLAEGAVPYPYWTDIGYLVADACMLLAVYAAFRPRARLIGVGRLLDGLIVVGTLALLWWLLLIRPVDAASDLATVVTLAYPVVGLAVVGIVVATRIFPARNGTLAMRLVVAGFACSVLANALYSHTSLTSEYLSGAWIELGWEAQGVLVAVGAFAAAQGIGRPADWARFREREGVETGFIVTGAIAVALTVLAVDARGHSDPVVLAGIALLGALVIGRVWALLGLRSERRSLVDEGTGAYGRDYLDDQIVRLSARARHFDEPFALAVAAPDGGRPAPPHGQLARRLVGAARDVDSVANLDGGRFAVLLPNVDIEEAAALSERLRLAVAGRPFEGMEGPALATVSVGLSAGREGDSPRSLVERGERALRRAAELGGNQVQSGVDMFDARPVEPLRLERLAALADGREGRAGHARAVAHLAVRLARELGLGERSVGVLALAALLHDLGKLAVPEVVLQKPGSLDDLEWAEVERHPTLGAELVTRLAGDRDAAEIVRAHHERWDGSGYPQRLREHAIPVEARVVAVADAFVAMTSDRPYRETRSETSALTAIWRESGSRFDPAVVSALLGLARDGDLPGRPDHAPNSLVLAG